MKNYLAIIGIVVGLGMLPSPFKANEASTKLLEKAQAKVTKIERLISAAEEGEADSQYRLAVMAFEELESSRSSDEAVLSWYLRAARQGHLRAQWKASELYRRLASNSYVPNEQEQAGFKEKATEYRIQALAWDRVLVRAKGEETIEYYNDVKYIRRDLLTSSLTKNEVERAEALSLEFELAIRKRKEK